MARKIKFAMKMRDDVEVRTLSELMISFPPPCTMMGLKPTSLRSTTS
ncbi:hypothetical protein [Enterocloster clostridioformis]|nr:hypothetical protein [Enterocloster clostridioformis]MDB2130894.1 hypothetical protein [Enterocloster clostridioformis]